MRRLMTSFISFNGVHRFGVQETDFCAHKQAEGVENNPWQKKKCTRQLALNAVRNAKYRSNLIQPGQFTAASAGPRNDPQDRDDTKPLTLNH